MNSRQLYKRFIYFILSIVVLIVASFIILGIKVWPYLGLGSSQLDKFVTACGCGEFVVGSGISRPIIAVLIGLSVVGFLLILSLVKSVFMFVRTVRFERALNKVIIDKTESKSVKIFRTKQSDPMAVCIGLLKPRIYISTGLEEVLTPFELWAVIEHELDHATKHDPLYRFLLKSSQPFFPFFGKIFNHYQTLSEVAADEAVGNNRDLQKAILKLVTVHQSTQNLAATFYSPTEVRINRFLGQPIERPKLTRFTGLVISLVFALGIGFHALAQQDIQTEALNSCLEKQPMCREIVRPSQQTVAPLLFQSRNVIMTIDY